MYNFAAANQHESIVYGAARPHYNEKGIQQWINFMHEQDIRRVCCLLTKEQLNRYRVDLLQTYYRQFEEKYVLWQPLKDFQIPESKILIECIIPFLILADEQQKKVLVHCSGGVGRTGIVLAAWLVSQRGLINKDAISGVKQNKRNPQEAIMTAILKFKNPYLVKLKLDSLLNNCRHAFN